MKLYPIYKTLFENSNERELPPGFTSNDFMSLEKFAQKELEEAEPLPDVKRLKQNPDDLIKKKLKGEPNKPGQVLLNPKLVQKTVKQNYIVDTSEFGGMVSAVGGKDNKEIIYDDNELKRLFRVRPSNILGTGNEKLKKTGTANITLPAFKGIILNEKNNQWEIITTCPNAGSCVFYCYVDATGHYRFPAPNLHMLRNVSYLINDWVGWKKQVLREIQDLSRRNKKNNIPKTLIRWHDSGDFLSEKYLEVALSIANQTPEVLHYAYTKEVSMLKNEVLPKNFKVRFSFGGKEDEDIDKSKDKHAIVVGSPMGKDAKHFDVHVDSNKYFDKKNNWAPYKDKIGELKREIAKKYNIKVNSILLMDELLKLPETNVPKWNVIVSVGNTDEAAYRDDVLGVYLILH